MKLTKENVYIDLRDKSKEELNLITGITGVENLKNYYYLHFYTPLNKWIRYHVWVDNTENKTEVTIEELKEILKMTKNQELIEEAKKRGYTHDNFKCLIDRKCEGIKDIENWYYEIFEDTLYTNTEGEGGNVVYRDGVWAEIIKPMENKEEQLIKEAKERGFLTEGNEFYSCFSDKNKLRIIKPYNSKLEINLYLDKGGCLRYYDGLNNEYDVSLCSNPAIYKDGVWAEIKNNNLTLTEQLQKAEAEVKRLKEAIEDIKIKVNDWVYIDNTKCFFKVSDGDFNHLDNRHRKITNPELIKLLEQEIK